MYAHASLKLPSYCCIHAGFFLCVALSSRVCIPCIPYRAKKCHNSKIKCDFNDILRNLNVIVMTFWNKSLCCIRDESKWMSDAEFSICFSYPSVSKCHTSLLYSIDKTTLFPCFRNTKSRKPLARHGIITHKCCEIQVQYGNMRHDKNSASFTKAV
jgi:hypothetical protein